MAKQSKIETKVGHRAVCGWCFDECSIVRDPEMTRGIEFESECCNHLVYEIPEMTFKVYEDDFRIFRLEGALPVQVVRQTTIGRKAFYTMLALMNTTKTK